MQARLPKIFHRFKKEHEVGFTALIGIFAYIALYFLNVYYTNHLSATDYGRLSVILQATTICSIICLFGTGEVIIRFIPKYVISGKKKSAYGLFRWSILLPLLLTCAFLGLGTIIFLTIILLDHLKIIYINSLHPLVFAFWLIPLIAYPTLFAYIFEAQKQFIFSALTINLLGIIIQLIILASVSHLGFSLDLNKILLIIGIAQLLVILVQYIYFKSKTLKNLGTATPKYHQKQWFSFALKMLINESLKYSYTALNLFLFAALALNKHEIGIFAALLLYSLVNQSIADVISITRCAYIEEASDNPNELQKITNRSNLHQIMYTLPVLIATIFFGKEILNFFSPEYVVAYPQLILLTVTFFIYAFSDTADDLLVYAGHEKIIIWNLITVSIFFILANLYFIPRYQLWGVTIVLSVGNILSAIFKLFIVRKKLGVKGLFVV